MNELEQYLAENQLSTKPKNKYKFIRSLGHGGSKNIIHVFDNDTSRGVAMATLSDFKNRTEEEIIAFLEEAKISAILEHPNIVPVHDIGLDDNGVPYFTMKRLKGRNLTELLFEIKTYKHRKIPSKYTTTYMLRIFSKICDAVSFAHDKGIVHLDIKPKNIHLGEFSEVQIMDWGLARFIDRKENATKDDFSFAAKELERMRSSYEHRRDCKCPNLDDNELEQCLNITKGTPGFMAPEQLNYINPSFDERTDVYALGAILYSILTNSNPIEGSIEEIITKTLTGDIQPPRKKAPENLISPALDAIAMKALALNPKHRYEAVVDLKRDINAYLSGFMTSAEKATHTRKILLYIKRNFTLTVIMGTILVSLTLFLAIFLRDVKKTQYSWSQIARQDFSSGFYDNSVFKFRSSDNSSDVNVWDEDSLDGLKCVEDQWLWYKSYYLPTNLRMDFSFFLKNEDLNLKIALNGFDKKTNSLGNPLGYCVKIDNINEKSHISLEFSNISQTINLKNAYVSLERNAINKISILRFSTAIIVQINDDNVLEYQNILPLSTEYLNSAGILLKNHSISLTEFKLSRLEPPERSSALLNGDSLADYGFYRKAIEEYLNLAKYNANRTLAFEALKKAYIYNSVNSDIVDRQNVFHTIKDINDYRHLNFFENYDVNHVEAVYFWRNGEFNKALKKMQEIVIRNPEFSSFNSILNQNRNNDLPIEIQKKLARIISKAKSVNNLNLSSLGISDLTIFEKLNFITNIDLSNNKIKDISALKDVNFDNLDISNNYLGALSKEVFDSLNVTNLIYQPQKQEED
ncbi:protein kinase [Lentisphaerota bacterium WC36G]|nr:protein kinase [Lentisphaerae bacterium WC36]